MNQSKIALCLAILTFCPFAFCVADDLTRENRMVRQLVTPMVSVVDGKPFRQALEQIAERAKLNVWLDRRVDPTASIQVGQLGPTVYAALHQIAASRDCEVLPVGHMVLVGRPDWLEKTLASLLAMKSPGPLTDIAWDDLTTPDEALGFIQGEPRADIDLPHDLWPRVAWSGVGTVEATNLVLSQFDQRTDGSDRVVSATSLGSFSRSYSNGDHIEAVRQLFKGDLVRGSVRVRDNRIQVVTSPRGHRMVTHLVLEGLSKSAKAGPRLANQAKFTLNLKARAGDAFNKFASTAGVTCKIQPEAYQACETIVTLQATDKTLVELVQIVAEKAKVKAEWTPNGLLISP